MLKLHLVTARVGASVKTRCGLTGIGGRIRYRNNLSGNTFRAADVDDKSAHDRVTCNKCRELMGWRKTGA